MASYLAIDIGASSGRHILAQLENNKIVTKEIYRFPNAAEEGEEGLVWSIDRLFEHVLEGLKRCGEEGLTPDYLGIDTWGVDFALLDEAGERIGPVFSYRDERTQGMDEKVDALIPPEELYARTGIQRIIINTIYQLMAVKEEHPERLEKSKRLLMTPDYLNYRLTGKAAEEYTIASTSGLLDAKTKKWDRELIERLGLPSEIFLDPVMPGTKLAPLKDEIAEAVGFNCEVILAPAHDTGSAYVAVPAQSERAAYLSSGTWSLLGTEVPEAVLSEEAAEANFTNEGGFQGRYRFLKNIMGMWLVQNIRKENDNKYSYGELADMAAKSSYDGLIDVNEDRFLAPDSMTETILEALEDGGYKKPEGLPDILRTVFRSLALCYRDAIAEMNQISGREADCLHIVGGGCQNEFLNQLTADACRIPVYAGPVEGTVLGNVLVQMIAAGEVSDIEEARQIIRRSFPIKKYEPEVWT